MIIKNIGNELICIGELSLMPGDETVIANSTAQSLIVRILEKHGKIQLVEESSRPAKSPAPKKVDSSDKEPSAGEKSVKKTAKNKKAKKATAKSE